MSHCRAEEVRFYVSPEGNDRWSGTLPAPNRAATDGPLATLPRARNAVRRLRRSQGGVLKQPVTVLVREGTYFLTEPLVLTPQDSGTAACPVTYAAYRGERPVISGGRLLRGWRAVRMNGRRAWATEIPEVRDGSWFFRELWVDGRRSLRARHPASGYLELPSDATAQQAPWSEGVAQLRFGKGDLGPWRGVADAELVLLNRWTDSHLPIEHIDRRKRLVTFGKRSVFRPEPGDPYYVENVVEALSLPGQWCLDSAKGMLYYLPRRGESMRASEAVAPVLEQILILKGNPSKKRYVQHVMFRGLTFSHAESWFAPRPRGEPKAPEVGGYPQAAVGVPGAIHGEGVCKCAFEGCAFAHLGGYAVELAGGCSANRIADCEMTDLGAGGVKLGERVVQRAKAWQTHGNELVRCHIHDGGLLFHSAVGVWLGQTYNNHVAHNHIHDFYYTGISVGWSWGYRDTLTRKNVIENNHIHHIGRRSNGDGPILSDMGGIYTLGVQPGTVIRYNIFHDIAALRYGGWGIYFDEGSTHIVAENNLVYRTTHGGFHQHYGRQNVVRNNIFALGRDTQLFRTRAESHLSFTFECNIVYWREGALFTGSDENLSVAMDRNLYWQEGGPEMRLLGLSWDEWRAKGKDRHSILADPGFVAPAKGDFRLQRGSPARRIGFRPIPRGKLGPRGLKR